MNTLSTNVGNWVERGLCSRYGGERPLLVVTGRPSHQIVLREPNVLTPLAPSPASPPKA